MQNKNAGGDTSERPISLNSLRQTTNIKLSAQEVFFVFFYGREGNRCFGYGLFKVMDFHSTCASIHRKGNLWLRYGEAFLAARELPLTISNNGDKASQTINSQDTTKLYSPYIGEPSFLVLT